MSEQPASVSADDLHAAGQQAAMWEDAVRHAERGESVAVIEHGEHVADVVPSGELDHLRRVWNTRRGEYRAFYTIDDDQRTITVVAVNHCRDTYRRRAGPAC